MNAILKDRAILIVEDEPLIAMEIVRAFESAGARVLKTSTLRQALVLVEEQVCPLRCSTMASAMVTARNCASGSRNSASRSWCIAGTARLMVPAGTLCSWPSQKILRCS